MTASVGLCATCRHARVQRTARGSEFWRCACAGTDARFARYPRLPVVSCEGHEAAPDAERARRRDPGGSN